jgi:hypothetical protein
VDQSLVQMDMETSQMQKFFCAAPNASTKIK